MAYITNYEVYDHGEANTTPWGDEHGNIVGLELEIGQLLDEEFIESCIDDGLIETEDSARAPIQLEREAQGNVQYELIFNADTPANVMGRLDEIREIRHDVSCHHETSCHVHVNRCWLSIQGIREIEYYRAAESIAPLIYAVSGRNQECWNRWTPANVGINSNIMDRLQYIDNAEPNDTGSYDDRYELCNCKNADTIEIRGFSNYFEFDVELIGFYIAIADTLIPDIALAMKGKKYAEDGETVLKTVSKFLNHWQPYVQRFQHLKLWKNYEDVLLQKKQKDYERAIEEFETISRHLESASNCSSSVMAAQYILDILKAYRDIELDVINLEDISETIRQLKDLNQRRFKKAIWRV